jgi:feruloyl esterase
MKQFSILIFLMVACGVAMAQSESSVSCANLASLKIDGVEITKAAPVPAGTTIPPMYPGAPSLGPLPAHCRVDGVINRRKGAGGEEFGIRLALTLPEKNAWNGDFVMQGGGGGNGEVSYPLGASYSGDKPALVRGFVVASTDTGHQAKTGPFDFSFMRDQQAYLDFAYQANAEVAAVAKKIIAQYYARPAAYSYFVGCSTGGREGMIL